MGYLHVDYDEIKQLTKDHTTSSNGKAVSIPGQGNPTESAFESELLDILAEQHERIELFVKSKTWENERQLNNLEKHLQKLVDAERSRSERSLPPEVQYACRYWIDHIQKSGTQVRNNSQVHCFLQEHFLHWLEALGWMGKISDGVHAITALELLVLVVRYVSSVAFSPDGKTLASASYDYTVKLWETGSGALLQTLKGHSSPVYSVAFSPDGQTLASASSDHTVKLWEAGSGALLQTLESVGRVQILSFSEDGTHLQTNRGSLPISSHSSTGRIPARHHDSNLFSRDHISTQVDVTVTATTNLAANQVFIVDLQTHGSHRGGLYFLLYKVIAYIPEAKLRQCGFQCCEEAVKSRQG